MMKMMMRNKIKYLLLAVCVGGCSIFYPPPPPKEPEPKMFSHEYYHTKALEERCKELKPMVKDFKPLCARYAGGKHYTCFFLENYYLRCENEE